MSKWINWLLTPDAFENDPRGYALNQAGHMALGAGLAFVIGLPLALLACVWWEAVHVSRGGFISDSIEDFGFVAVGALALFLASPVILALGLIYLGTGILRRMGL